MRYVVLISLLFSAACLAFLLFFVGRPESDSQPYCPTEDSCYVEYNDGHWTVIEGERP